MTLRTAPWQQATAALPREGRCVGVQLDDEGVWLFRPSVRTRRSLELFCSLADLKAFAPDASALALRIARERFDTLLLQAVDTAHDPERFPLRQTWRLAVRFARVTIQWVPARDPQGETLLRCTARLRLSQDLAGRLAEGGVLEERSVDDLLADLAQTTPVATPYPIEEPALRRRLLRTARAQEG